MTDQMPGPRSTAEIHRAGRIHPRPATAPAGLAARGTNERQQKLLDEFSMVVVDGVRKPREDQRGFADPICHAELYKAHMDVPQK